MSTEGPVIDEVRQRAMAISERYRHGPRRYASHLADAQDREMTRLVTPPPEPERAGRSVATENSKSVNRSA